MFLMVAVAVELWSCVVIDDISIGAPIGVTF
jgi:hypothetical protein